MKVHYSNEDINILPPERGKSKLSIALSLIKRNICIFPIILRFKQDLLIGADASIAQLDKFISLGLDAK